MFFDVYVLVPYLYSERAMGRAENLRTVEYGGAAETTVVRAAMAARGERSSILANFIKGKWEAEIRLEK